MGLAVKRQHVVLAKRVKLDVLDDHHLAVLLLELGREQDFARILVVTLGQKAHGLGDPLGRLEQSLARRVFPEQFQNSLIVLAERPESVRVETLLFIVVAVHRDGFTGQR